MRMSPEDRPLSIKYRIFSKIIKSYPITPFIMWKVKDHVCPDLDRRVPSVRVLIGTLLQECVSNFTVYMLILQNVTIITDNMRINKLESGGLAKSKELKMNKSILNNI
jgi:hypothetical protein